MAPAKMLQLPLVLLQTFVALKVDLLCPFHWNWIDYYLGSLSSSGFRIFYVVPPIADVVVVETIYDSFRKQNILVTMVPTAEVVVLVPPDTWP